MTNPYAPPRAAVRDIVDPLAQLSLADRGTRFVAAFLDGIIFGAMVYLPGAIGIAMTTDARSNGVALGAGAAIALVGLIVWSWLTIVNVRRNGQSLGKKVVNIKVVRADGSPISLARLFWLRNVVNTLISFVPLYGIIDVLFIFGESRECLHDKIADTIVIKA